MSTQSQLKSRVKDNSAWRSKIEEREDDLLQFERQWIRKGRIKKQCEDKREDASN